MEWVNWIIANREIIKIFYGLIIGIICLTIVAVSHRLYHLSFYEGIRYFSNAFLFFGIAFLIRYIIGGIAAFGIIDISYATIANILFEFFLLMAGFFLIYSLLWKKIEGSRANLSSIFNMRILIFYIMAVIITILDYLWGFYYFMFIAMVFIFVFASIISYINYLRNGKKGRFLKFYFIAMILALVAWLLNAVTAIFLNWERSFLVWVYFINIVIFLLFLYGIIKITKRPNKNK